MGKKVWQGLSKLQSACPEESFEHFSLKKRWFLNEICTLSKRSSGLCQNFTAGFPKLQSMCPEKICERDKIWKSDDFLLILYFELKKTRHWAKQFSRGCQNCNRRVQGNLLSIFHWKNDDFWMKFVLWAKKVPDLAKTLRQGFRNFNLCVRRKIVWEKKIEKTMIT